MITLQDAGGKTYRLAPTLAMIAAFELEFGSLYQLAEELLAKRLPLSTLVAAVRALYRAAGCAAELDDFLLTRPCAEILIGFLLGAIGPVERSQESKEG